MIDARNPRAARRRPAAARRRPRRADPRPPRPPARPAGPPRGEPRLRRRARRRPARPRRAGRGARSAAAEVAALAGRLSAARPAGGRPRVVLVGPPNAGKSRLFNALVGGDHAIVSPRAGTTRDYLSRLCDCDGLPVELIDTAGIEPAATRSRARPRRAGPTRPSAADLVLVCQSVDTGMPLADSAGPPARSPPGLDQVRPRPAGADEAPGRRCCTSAETGEGLDAPAQRDRRPPSQPGCRRRPAREHRGPLPREPGPRREALRSARRRRSWPAAATSSSRSTSAWPSTSWARSSAPSSPTTSSTASSGGSASASKRSGIPLLDGCLSSRRHVILGAASGRSFTLRRRVMHHVEAHPQHPLPRAPLPDRPDGSWRRAGDRRRQFPGGDQRQAPGPRRRPQRAGDPGGDPPALPARLATSTSPPR